MSNETNDELYAKMAPVICDVIIKATMETVSTICRHCRPDAKTTEILESTAFQYGAYHWAVLNKELCSLLGMEDKATEHYMENTLKAMEKHNVGQTGIPRNNVAPVQKEQQQNVGFDAEAYYSTLTDERSRVRRRYQERATRWS